MKIDTQKFWDALCKEYPELPPMRIVKDGSMTIERSTRGALLSFECFMFVDIKAVERAMNEAVLADTMGQ